MLNIIWIAMLGVGLIVGIINGTIEEVTAAAFDAAGEAVTFCLGLMGILCLWCGFVKIAEAAGLMEGMARLFRPLIRKLFPDISHDDKAVSAIVMNLAADMLGLGNAATPLGIHACKEIKRAETGRLGRPTGQSKEPSKAPGRVPGRVPSRSICLFLLLNTVSVQLIPSTVIAMRAEAGSAAPSDILIPVWIVSAATCILGLALAKLCEKFYFKRNQLP